MHDKKYSACFVMIFLLLMALPLTNMDFSEISESENRRLEPFPEKIGRFFGDKINLYISDRFGGREQIIRWQQELDYALIGRVENQKIIMGADGWLFLKVDDSVDNFQNKKLFTEDELQKVRDELLQFKEALDKRGIEFYFIIAPDKNRIYGEKYPEFIRKAAAKGRAELLVEYLRSNGIDAMYPKDELLAGKSLGDVYWHKDTHWNSYGAFIAYQVMMQGIKKEHDDLVMLDFSEYDLVKPEVELQDMRHMANIPDGSYSDPNARDLSLQKKEAYIYEYIKNEQEAGVETINQQPLNDKKVVFLRDSFVQSMIPYISESFREVDYIWSSDIDANFNRIVSEKPDIVVMEVAERRVKVLLQGVTVK